MAAKRKSSSSGKAALDTQLKAAEKRWQQQKRKAREAKTAAREAKKTVKRLRKLVADAPEAAGAAAGRRMVSQDRVRAASRSPHSGAKTAKLRIAGTPEARVRRTQKKRKRPNLSKAPAAPEQPSAGETSGPVTSGADVETE
jgi:hypothetical protein